MEPNFKTLNTPYYRRLSDSQIQVLHDGTLEVLERTGVRVLEEEALELFKKGGADITDGNRVRIPSWRVEWAIKTAPKQIILYDQEGHAVIRLRGRNCYYGNGSDLVNIIDHRNNQRRPATLQDIREIVAVLDALPHIDFVMSGFVPSELSPEIAERHQMQVMIENTKKPIVYVTTSLPNTQAKVAMAEAVAGSEDALRRKPFCANYINIAHPFRHNPESLQKLLYLAGKGLPAIYRPSIVTRGISTPITVPGFLVANNAAQLVGLVLSQLKREGAPFIRCCHSGGTFDMRTTVGLHSAPEVRGFQEDLAHWYGLPGFGIGGTSASKCADQQAALEAALTLMSSTISGAHLIHDVGYMESGLTGSLPHLVICHEIIAWLKAYMKGLEMSDETLALDVIDEVAPDGSFIDTQHTVRHLREDHYPELRNQKRFEDWFGEGSLTLLDRAAKKVETILAVHKPRELPEKVRKAIQKIVDEGVKDPDKLERPELPSPSSVGG
jgi:trimethylamine---corrinoid protein Co-methyltransferase